MLLISIRGSSNEKIRTLIRHELVHYALSIEFERKIYDTYNSYFKKAVDLCQGNEELNHHFGDIIGIMGSKDITSVDKINEQLGRTNFIIVAI